MLLNKIKAGLSVMSLNLLTKKVISHYMNNIIFVSIIIAMLQLNLFIKTFIEIVIN